MDATDKAPTLDVEFSDSLMRVLDKCKSRLTKAEEEDFAKTSLLNVQTRIAHIQDQQGKEQKMINLTRIAKFLRSMEEWGDVVSSFADITLFLPFVWGPVKALLQVQLFFQFKMWQLTCEITTGCQYVCRVIRSPA
jgi:hypothetical protein